MKTTELVTRENTARTEIESLRDDILSIQQPRSDYQLEHFVVGSHDLPGRQRAQAILELQAKLFAIQRNQLEQQRIEIEIKQNKSKVADTYEGKLAELEVSRLEVNLAELELTRIGSLRETEFLLKLLGSLPKYTYEQLQEEEQKYWERRLERQALEDVVQMGRVSAGNLDAILQTHRHVGTDESAGVLLQKARATHSLPSAEKKPDHS